VKGEGGKKKNKKNKFLKIKKEKWKKKNFM
jgi:hypothetical protein